MPSSGRVPPLPTDAASSVPTNGPTQANEVSENVSPISSVPAIPPCCVPRSSLVSTDDGMVISKAPSRLRPKARNTSAMKPFTQGFDPSCTTPNGPRTAVVSRPSPENSTTIPRQNSDRLQDAFAPRSLPVQEERHGDRDHREDAGREDGGQAEAEGDQQERAQALRVRAGGRGGAELRASWAGRSLRRNPAGMAGGRRCAAGSTVKVAAAVRRTRRHAHPVVAGLVADFGGNLRAAWPRRPSSVAVPAGKPRSLRRFRCPDGNWGRRRVWAAPGISGSCPRRDSRPR